MTWEYSDLSFFITLGLLCLGLVFLVVPWVFVYRWAGRLVVVLLLGPQNIILDRFWYQYLPTDDQSKLRKVYEKRMFEARCKQEDVTKLRVFRHLLFGRYGTMVPSILWTPHQDFPMPSSSARTEAETAMVVSSGDDNAIEVMRVTGQKLHGKIIPRPEDAFKRNKAKFKRGRESLTLDIFSQHGEVGGGESAGRNRDSVPELDMTDVHDFHDDSDASFDSSDEEDQEEKEDNERRASRLLRIFGTRGSKVQKKRD